MMAQNTITNPSEMQTITGVEREAVNLHNQNITIINKDNLKGLSQNETL